MGLARELARLRPNSSGLLPNTNIEAMAASKLTGQVPDANAPSGSVIQVVQTQKTDTFSTTTGTTYVDITGMSVSITPSSTNSKILVLVNCQVGFSNTGNNSRIRLLRNGTTVYKNDSTGHPEAFQGVEQGIGGFQYMFMPFTAMYLDSPSSVSSTTYKLQISRANTGGTTYVNRNNIDTGGTDQPRVASSITVMEISA
jgi:hypothetical protein